MIIKKLFTLSFVFIALSPVSAAEVTIFAASSLTEALNEIVSLYPDYKSNKDKISLNFASSSTLARQINAGAPADIYISANTKWMENVIRNGLIDAKDNSPLLANSLVVIAPLSSKYTIGSLDELTHERFKTIAIAGESVPAGIFARQALTTKQVDFKQLHKKFVVSDNVKIALKWVSLSQVDAGFVYQTDAQNEKGVKILYPIADTDHEPIIYPIAPTRASRSKVEVQNFLKYLKSEIAKKVFKEKGFQVL